MKTIISLIALASLSSPAFCKTVVFNGHSVYTKAGLEPSSNFNELEQLGVERDAEKRAYDACVQAGATDCVILNATDITTCNQAHDLYSTGCEASAVARGTQD